MPRALIAAILLTITSASLCLAEPTSELLWPQGAPAANGSEAKDKPTLISYLAAADGRQAAAVVVCPGGGYGGLAMGHEGHDIAKWFNSFGVSAFICDYRHRGKGYGHPAPLQDAQRAIRTVRSRAKELGIAPDKIGVMGFSAGGHLASTSGTHFDLGMADSKDPIQRASSRPDFMILCYPVIAFGEPFTHYGSQRNLLGQDASEAMVKEFSNEKQVTKETPPTFLFHTTEDRAVPVQNSIQFYSSLIKAGVPAEMHVYEKGRHGVGLGLNIPGTSQWSQQLQQWLSVRGYVERK